MLRFLRLERETFSAFREREMLRFLRLGREMLRFLRFESVFLQTHYFFARFLFIRIMTRLIFPKILEAFKNHAEAQNLHNILFLLILSTLVPNKSFQPLYITPDFGLMDVSKLIVLSLYFINVVN